MALQNPTKFAATALALFTLLMSTVQATPHVSIANSFTTPTEFICKSNLHSRRAYTASAGEVFYYAFSSEDNQYWDCLVTNKHWGMEGTFRFWGDDTHGGPQLFSCYNCNWSLDPRGVFFYLDGVWRFWYVWEIDN